MAEPATAAAGPAAKVSFEKEGVADLPASNQLPEEAEEHLVQRLMQRVDRLLEQRLREAIAVVLEEQTRSMALQLRQEVESVVRQSVRDAVEQERPQVSAGPQS